MSETSAPRPAPSARHGILALVVASLLWGTTGAAASMLPDLVSPLAIGASTMAVGGVLLFITSPRMSWAVLGAASGRRWVMTGVVGVVIYPLAFYSSMQLAGVAIGNVVSLGSAPLFAALLERVVERRRLSPVWALSTGLAVTGVALLASAGRAAEGPRAPELVPGVLLGLVAGAAYALYTWASSRAIATGSSSRGVIGAMFGVGAVVLLIPLLLFGAPLLATASFVGIAAYLAVGPMLLAYVAFGVGLRTVRSSTATTVTLLEPVVATVLAVVVVGERLSAAGWLGMALVSAGLLVVATASRRERSSAHS